MNKNNVDLERFTAVSAFRHAESIRQSLNTINWMSIEWRLRGGMDMEYMQATHSSRHIMGALLTEVYLKALMKLRGKAIPKSHKLYSLFKKLDKHDKNEIVKEVDGIQSTIDKRRVESGFPFIIKSPSFIEVIDSHNDSFEYWRYAYEADDPRQMHEMKGCLEMVSDAIRKRLVTLQPDWAQYQYHDAWRTRLGEGKSPNLKENNDHFYLPTIFQDMR